MITQNYVDTCTSSEVTVQRSVSIADCLSASKQGWCRGIWFSALQLPCTLFIVTCTDYLTPVKVPIAPAHFTAVVCIVHSQQALLLTYYWLHTIWFYSLPVAVLFSRPSHWLEPQLLSLLQHTPGSSVFQSLCPLRGGLQSKQSREISIMQCHLQCVHVIALQF